MNEIINAAGLAGSGQPHTITPQQEKTIADIYNRFQYHAPKGDQAERYATIRDKAREFALYLAVATPASREQSLALTKLEEAVMHANSAIARNE